MAAKDFLRFLFEWQRVAPGTRMEGPDALAAITGQLEGFEAAAGAWESEILPARLGEYDPAWPDDLCLSGRLAWARLRPRHTAVVCGERRLSFAEAQARVHALANALHALGLRKGDKLALILPNCLELLDA